MHACTLPTIRWKALQPVISLFWPGDPHLQAPQLPALYQPCAAPGLRHPHRVGKMDLQFLSICRMLGAAYSTVTTALGDSLGSSLQSYSQENEHIDSKKSRDEHISGQ